MINFSFGHFFLCWKARSAQVSGPIVHSRLLNVEPRALYRCQGKGKRCSQQNKVFKKELARCCRDRRKTARRRFCYARGAQEEGKRNKLRREVQARGRRCASVRSQASKVRSGYRRD